MTSRPTASARPPSPSDRRDGRRGVVAARRSHHGRALRGQRAGDRAADAARRAGHERDLAGQIEHARASASTGRSPSRQRAAVDRRVRSSTDTVASRWIFRTRPLNTVPGPTSTYVVTPSDARRRTTASQRTGDDTCSTSASIADLPRRASARRPRWRRSARADRATVSARSSGASRSCGRLHQRAVERRADRQRHHPLRAQRLGPLAGARDRVARPAITTCPAPFKFAGLTTSPCGGLAARLRDLCRHRARGSPPSRRSRPAPPPACSGRGAARSAARRRKRRCRRRRWPNTRRGCGRRRTPASSPRDASSR